MRKLDKEKAKGAKGADEDEEHGRISPSVSTGNGGGDVSYFHQAQNVAIFGNLTFNTTISSQQRAPKSPFSGVTLIDWYGREYYLDVHFTVSYEVRLCILNELS